MSCIHEVIYSIIKHNNLELFLNLIDRCNFEGFSDLSLDCYSKHGDTSCVTNIDDFVLCCAIKTDANRIINYKLTTATYHPDSLAKIFSHSNGRAKSFKLLLEKGMNIHKLSFMSNTSILLEFALKYKNLGILKWILSHGVSVDNFDGFTVIQSLFTQKLTKKRKKILNVLITHNFNVNLVFRGFPTKTPLICAIDSNNYNMTEYLLSRGADPNFGDIQYDTMSVQDLPLSVSITRDNMKITRLLLDYGADPNFRNLPMMNAIFHNRPNIVHLLLNYGAYHEFCGEYISFVPAPILYSIENNLPYLFRRILPLIKDINKPYDNENTLLHYACQYNNYEIIKIILETGHADMYAVNEDLYNPIFSLINKYSSGKPHVSRVIYNNTTNNTTNNTIYNTTNNTIYNTTNNTIYNTTNNTIYNTTNNTHTLTEPLILKTMELFLQHKFDMFKNENNSIILGHKPQTIDIGIIELLFKYNPKEVMKDIMKNNWLHYICGKIVKLTQPNVSLGVLKKICYEIQNYCKGNCDTNVCKGCLKKYINVFDSEKHTPLHYSMKHHNYEIAKFLLENGAEVNPKHSEAKTPYESIGSFPLKGRIQMENLLKKFGCTDHLMNENSITKTIIKMTEEKDSRFYKGSFPFELTNLIITYYKTGYFTDKYPWLILKKSKLCE